MIISSVLTMKPVLKEKIMAIEHIFNEELLF